MRRQSSSFQPVSEVNRQLNNTAYDNVVIVKNNIANINSVATVVVPNLPEILLASDNATIATNQADIATTQANLTKAIYDNFDDRYLGSKSVEPTLDNDGNAILKGALYFNTVNNRMYVYSGKEWIVTAVIANNTLISTSTTEALTAAQGRVLNERLIAVENWSGIIPTSITLHENTINTDYIIPNGNNGLTVSPITIANDVTVELQNDSLWVII